MTHILFLAIMGMIAGTIAGFWTRIIMPGMILSFVGDLFEHINLTHTWKTGRGEQHLITKFLSCIFCLSPWLCFILDACYIWVFTPAWYLCIIGVFASLGAGNLVAEIIYALRGRE